MSKIVKVKAAKRKGKIVKAHSRRISEGRKAGVIHGTKVMANVQMYLDDLSQLPGATMQDLGKMDALFKKHYGEENLDGGAPISHVLQAENNPKKLSKYLKGLKKIHADITKRSKK